MSERISQDKESRKVQKLREVSAALLSGEYQPLVDGLLSTTDGRTPTADQFAAHLIWTGRDPMLPERPYLIRLAGIEATVQVTDLPYRVDTDTLEHLAAKTLISGEIGYCKIALDRAVPFDDDAGDDWSGALSLIHI